jgi:multidrug resistance efflux pump
MADREATVVAIAAVEGDHVSPGVALVSLRDRNLESRIAQQRQSVALLETQLQQALAAAELELMVRTHEIEDDLLRADIEASNLLREQFACELEHSMLADLVADNSTAAIWNDSDPVYRSAVLDVHPQTGNEVQTALRLELIANSAEVLAAQVDMCDRRRESLEQLKSEQLTLSVPSSAFGIVGLFRVNPGMAVEPGMPLVDILDDETRYLSAHISSRYISEFAKGDAVDLIFPGGQRHTGVVDRIAPQAQIDSLDPRKSDDSVVLVDIAPSGRYWPTLPIGSQVQVLVRE